VGRRRADDRADVREGLPVGDAGAAVHAAHAVHHHRNPLPRGTAVLEDLLLEVRRSRVRRPDEHEHPAAALDVRVHRLDAHVRVDRHRVGVEPVDSAERRVDAAEERLRVGVGGDADVAALGVGEDEQAGRAGGAGDPGERRPPGRGEGMKEGARSRRPAA
jgi:hypothetical protein